MQPEQAQQYYQMARDYNQSYVWLFVIFFLLAPLLLTFSYALFVYISRKKCPNCGSKKDNKHALRAEEVDNVTTCYPVVICGNCGKDIE